MSEGDLILPLSDTEHIEDFDDQGDEEELITAQKVCS